MLAASPLAERFSIIAISQRISAWYREVVEGYGFGSRLASIRALDQSIRDIGGVQDEHAPELKPAGIAAGLVHLPNDIYSAFGRYAADLPGVRRFAERQISLPCGWWLSEQDCRAIADRVQDLV